MECVLKQTRIYNLIGENVLFLFNLKNRYESLLVEIKHIEIILYLTC